MSGNHSLQTRGVIPATPFANEWFSFEIYLVNRNGFYDPNHTDANAKLQVTLVHEDGSTTFNGFCLKSLDDSRVDGSLSLSRATTSLSVSITDESLCHAAFKVCLCISIQDPDGRSLASLLTSPMKLVKYRLDLQGSSVADKFYKDMGGKTKMMEVKGTLLNARGLPPQHNIALKALLQYEGGETVNAPPGRDPQSFLVVEACYHDTNGEVVLRFRVNSVSKNHNGKRFRVLVGPESIAPINSEFSSPILVLSKKPSERIPDSNAGAKPKPATKRKRESARSMRSRKETPAPKPKPTPQLTPQPTPQHTPTLKPCALKASASGDLLESSIALVESLEWCRVGYHSGPEGPDFSRPIFRCPSCERYRGVLPHALPTNCVPVPSEKSEHDPTCKIWAHLQQYKQLTRADTKPQKRAKSATGQWSNFRTPFMHRVTKTTEIVGRMPSVGDFDFGGLSPEHGHGSGSVAMKRSDRKSVV